MLFRCARRACHRLVCDRLHLAIGLALGGCLRRRAGRHRAGQVMPRLFAQGHAPAGGQETHDQADLFARPAGLVPGQPHAVAVAQFGLGVVPGELFGCENVLAVGLDVAGVAAILLESVHHTRPFHAHRLGAGGGVKQQAAGKAPRRRAAGRLHNAVSPNGDHPAGHLRLLLAEQA